MGVGLVQGRHVGTVILDFDGELGLATLAQLEAKGLPNGIRQFTPRGGVHVMLAHPGVHVPTRKNVLPGMDIRGDGGFVVAHPSLGANGRPYAWDADAHPDEAPLEDVPEWLLGTITGPVHAETGQAEIIRAPSAAGPLGLPIDRVTDGREQYMRDTILAVCRDLRDSLGRMPTPAELIEAAWPQYAARVDFTRPGRGKNEFEAKARYTLARAAQGLVKGFTAEPIPDTAPDGVAFDPETGEILEPAKPKVKPGRAMRLMTIAEVEALPPPEWLIDGLIPENGLVIPYGPPGAGKTFLVLSQSLHIAAGMPWMGKAVRQGVVVYVVGEGLGGFSLRLKAMRQHYGMPDSLPFYMVPRAVNFRQDAEVAELVRLVKAAVPEGTRISLVVIDTLARAMPGVDENSAQEVGLIIAKCDEVREELSCTVEPIHHTGKDVERGLRGSNAILGAVDATFLIQAAGKGQVRLINEKQKDGEPHKPMIFTMEPVMVGLRSSLVPVLVERAAPGRPASDGKPEPDEVRMRVLLAMEEAKLDMMKFADVAGLLGCPSGRAKAELGEMIPIGRQNAAQVGAFRLWKSAQGTAANAPQYVHREVFHDRG